MPQQSHKWGDEVIKTASPLRAQAKVNLWSFFEEKKTNPKIGLAQWRETSVRASTNYNNYIQCNGIMLTCMANHLFLFVYCPSIKMSLCETLLWRNKGWRPIDDSSRWSNNAVMKLLFSSKSSVWIAKAGLPVSGSSRDLIQPILDVSLL